MTSLTGQVVGAYTLRSLLGQGGTGSVWLAERTDGRYTGVAAVKLLNASVVGADGEARLRSEGTILGRLRHPHIAQLIDAGLAPTGQPYLIREHVDGERIDAYCDAKRFSIEARLQLFLNVLAAVAHAHANLIVHRDLKPSNVLVTKQGQVKLLDFGIAKLLEGDGRGTPAMVTPNGAAAWSPEYAAPEQLTGGVLTTATDVYALGALLYVLLTGQHPARVQTNSPAELVRAIVETEPLRASEAVISGRATRAETATDTAVKRATQPKRLRALLQGDLDNIVAKALKKAPAERYGSVEAFADDVRRYLAHQPVSARKESLEYRTQKFVRRHRWAVAASVVTVAGLAAALIVVNRERAVAQRRFVQVRQLANKLFDIDAQIDQLPGSSPARQLIVETSLDYLQRLSTEARGDRELALEVGTAYLHVARMQGVPIAPNLGQPDKAEQSLREAQRLIQSVLTAQPDNRTAILRMAQINHDRMIIAGLRRADGALSLAGVSATWLTKYLDGGDVEPADAEQVVLALNNVGNRYRLAGQFDQALSLTRRGLDIAGDYPNLEHHVGNLLLSQSSILRDQGALEAAVNDLREAATVLEPPAGAGHGERTRPYIMALTELGQLLGAANGISLERSDEGLAFLQRAFDTADALTHRDPTDVESRVLLSTAGRPLGALLRPHDAQQSAEVYDHVLRHLVEIKDNTQLRHEEVGALVGSTYPLRTLGNHAEAQRRLSDAFSRLSELKLYPAEKVDIGSEVDDALRARADSEAAGGNAAEAAESYRQLLDQIMAAKPSVENNLTATSNLCSLYGSLASLYRLSGRPDLAGPIETQRLALWTAWERKLPKNDFVLRRLAAVRVQ